MEKLIELLNEYYKERYNTDVFEVDTFSDYSPNDRGYFNYVDRSWGISEADIISKRYWFIKRLVENDKIDKKKIDKAERRPIYVTDDMFALYDLDECVIMLLSISDTPIDDLISYLK